jgi:hypothetical protein
MPPPALAESSVAQFVVLPELLLDPLLLPHPAASMTQPSAAATATLVFFVSTFPPLACMTQLGQGREHRRGKR